MFKKEKRGIVGLLILLVFLFYITGVFALSEEGIEAEEKLEQAKKCFEEIESRGVPVVRAGQLLQEAKDQFSAQSSLEEVGRTAKYGLTMEFSEEVCALKESSLRAQDELLVFEDTYKEISMESDLSDMEEEYNLIYSSFADERFEETSGLIEEGYNKMSEIQASQTALNLFASTVANTFTNFIKKNWLVILIVSIVVIILFAAFWRVFKRIRIKWKLKSLKVRKDTLKELIKKLQKKYFGSKTMSETEYQVKLEKFKDMIRDVDRQIPLLNEEIVKLKKKERDSKNRFKLWRI